MINEELLFDVSTPERGGSLWKSDGTDTGTERVYDFDVVPSYAAVRSPRVVEGDRVFFPVHEAEGGRELWVSDGTEEGTLRTRDLVKGEDGSSPSDLTPFAGAVFFVANGLDDTLWSSDGTELGTVEISDLEVDTILGEYDGWLYFAAEELGNRELYRTDGTAVGTEFFFETTPGLDSIGFEPLAALTDGLLFLVQGAELWITDGTVDGTQEFFDINGDLLGGASVRDPLVVDEELYFGAFNGGAYGIWKTDGTEDGTVELLEVEGATFTPRAALAHEGIVYYTCRTAEYGAELWVTDGTSDGTTVLDLRPGVMGSDPSDFCVFEDVVYFAAESDRFGTELWATDGTLEGTVLAVDHSPGYTHASPAHLTVLGEQLLLSAFTDGISHELSELCTVPVVASVSVSEGDSPLVVEISIDVDSDTSFEVLWEFGDGTVSTDQDPIHEYPEVESDYLATVTLTNDCGTRIEGLQVIVAVPEASFIRGDVDGNGVVSPLVDALNLLEFWFATGDAPQCMDAADVDDSGTVSALLDSLFLLFYGFQSGPEPPSPGPSACGDDPSGNDDGVLCVVPSGSCS